MSSDKQPIIIKKIKKAGHEGHHGGAWKVAYADFVTAMMAFFLLMWLLNATSEDQKRGISNYFGPPGDSFGAGGSGGFLGGLSLDSKGNYKKTQVNSTLESAEENDENKSNTMEGGEEEGINSPDSDHDKKILLKEARDIVDKNEDEIFQKAAQELKQAIEKVPELKELQKSLIIEKTPEGLRIQIVDQQKYSMFPKGSFEMYSHTRQLLGLVAKVVQKLPNKISISGHTDSHLFSNDQKYSNWELSADRANASRRVLLDMDIAANRIINITGKADTEPLVPGNPADDKNRRISIVLLYTEKQNNTKKINVLAASTPTSKP